MRKISFKKEMDLGKRRKKLFKVKIEFCPNNSIED